MIYPEIKEYVMKNKKGELIAPCGSRRAFFLPIIEDRLEEVKKVLEEKLFRKAKVYTLQELVDKGFFDLELVHQNKFEALFVNLVVLPFEEYSVFWLGEDEYLNPYDLGAHGGLTEHEMLTPFMAMEV
jgi:hypothetical protein